MGKRFKRIVGSWAKEFKKLEDQVLSTPILQLQRPCHAAELWIGAHGIYYSLEFGLLDGLQLTRPAGNWREA
jgi:hypothetical protein